uniref:Uncharacterized protein n=1 Tax=Eutreptiella gymnastica TaxID=73025 RepID=A0A7S4CXP6_9EUGL
MYIQGNKGDHGEVSRGMGTGRIRPNWGLCGQCGIPSNGQNLPSALDKGDKLRAENSRTDTCKVTNRWHGGTLGALTLSICNHQRKAPRCLRESRAGSCHKWSCSVLRPSLYRSGHDPN